MRAFNDVAIDPKNRQRVYAGSDTGLWHSNDADAIDFSSRETAHPLNIATNFTSQSFV